MYLIVKESINNALKYSGATEITFICTINKNKIWLGIEDNGKGFDTNTTAGNGMKNIKNRAIELNGRLILESIKDQGSKVFIELSV